MRSVVSLLLGILGVAVQAVPAAVSFGERLVFEPSADGHRFVGRVNSARVSVVRDGFTLGRGPSVLRARFVGTTTTAVVSGSELLPSQSHYLSGSDPQRWRTNVPHYARARVSGAYPGIDVEYYQAGDGMEFDLYLRPGADPGVIRMAFDGAGALRLTDEGALEFETATGVIRQLPPRVFQTIGGQRVSVVSRYELLPDQQVLVQLGKYDDNEALVIDPVLEWATFLGGSGQDQVNAVAVDAAGNAYAAGFTSSSDFPTASPQDGELTGLLGGFVSKISADGSQLIWSTYLGGSLRDEIRGLQVDADGSVYVSGFTESGDFPTTGGAAQTTLNGPVDAFVTKLLPDGSGFDYSTLFGGPDVEFGKRIALDATGAVYLMGDVDGASFPATAGVFQTQPGGMADSFLAKFSADGSAVEWATYFGGSGIEVAYDIVADPGGGVLLAGQTAGSDLPTTKDAFQITSGGGDDGYIAQFSADGASVDYLTYFGGGFLDVIRGIALDSQGNVWAAGGTASDDLPTTPDAENPSRMSDRTSGFLARLPLPPRTTPGPAQMAPYVTYVGDELQNFGLAITASQGPSTGLKNSPGRAQAFGEFISYSLSNFTNDPVVRGGETVNGTFGSVTDYDLAGTPIDTVFVPGADGNTIVTSQNGSLIVLGGVGLANAQTTPGSVQSSFGGGSGTLPADGYLAEFVPPIANPDSTLTIEKRLLSPTVLLTPGLLAGTATELKFRITVTNVGTATARQVRLIDDGINFFVQELPIDVAALVKRSSKTEVIRCTFENLRVDGVFILSTVCPPVDLAPGEQILLIVKTSPNGPGTYRNRATATDLFAQTVSDELSGVAGNTRLELTKELVEPTSRPVEPGTAVTFRLTVNNVGERDATEVSVSDNPNYLVTSIVPERNPNGVFCQIVQDRGVNILARCRRGILAAGDSFSVLVEGVLSGDGTNNAAANAVNAEEPVFASGSVPVAEEQPNETVECTGAFEEDPSGISFASTFLGANNFKARVPRFRGTCAIPESVSQATIPATASLDLGAPVTNTPLTEGPLSGARFSLIGPSGQSIELPLHPGSDANNVQTDSFDGPVIRNTFSTAFDGVRVDATGLESTGSILPGFRINSPLIDGGFIEALGSSPLSARDEVIVAAKAQPVSGGVSLTISATEGFPNAWSEETDAGAKRLIATLSGLPAAAIPGLMPACIFDAANLGALIQRVEGADESGSGGQLSSSCEMFTPPLLDGRIVTVYELLGFDRGAESLLRNLQIPFQINGVGDDITVNLQVGLGPQLPSGADPASFPPPLYRAPEPVAFSLTAPTPALTPEGVVSAASNLAASHGLVAAFGTNMANSAGQAQDLPLPREINGARVFVTPDEPEFEGIRSERAARGPEPVKQTAGVFAPLLSVSPTQINFQLPWEIDVSSGFVNLTVIRDGIAGPAVRAPVTMFSPAAFTFDFGPGRAVAVNPDGSVAHPDGSFEGAIASRPAKPGEAIYILGTGLGPVTPDAVTGFNSLDVNGNFVRRDTVETPQVTIGGVDQQVLFSGLSPQFVGVYQINIIVNEATPAGDQQPLIIEIGGVSSREDVTVAVSP